jgi:hypothetical protein
MYNFKNSGKSVKDSCGSVILNRGIYTILEMRKIGTCFYKL